MICVWLGSSSPGGYSPASIARRRMPGPAPGHGDKELRFTGWLGLLRALYEVTGSPGNGSAGEL